MRSKYHTSLRIVDLWTFKSTKSNKRGQRIFPVGGGVIKNIVLSLHHGTYKTTSRDPTGRTNRQL